MQGLGHGLGLGRLHREWISGILESSAEDGPKVWPEICAASGWAGIRPREFRRGWREGQGMLGFPDLPGENQMKLRQSLAPILFASSLLLPLLAAPHAKAAVVPAADGFVEAEAVPQGPQGTPGSRGQGGQGGRGGRVSGAPEPGFYALLAASGVVLGMLYVASRRRRTTSLGNPA